MTQTQNPNHHLVCNFHFIQRFLSVENNEIHTVKLDT